MINFRLCYLPSLLPRFLEILIAPGSNRTPGLCVFVKDAMQDGFLLVAIYIVVQLLLLFAATLQLLRRISLHRLQVG